MAQDGTLLHAPDIYMDKIAVGPGYPKGVVDLDAPAEENIVNLAKAKGVKAEAITAMILDRPRHADLIGAVRKAGAAVSLISDVTSPASSTPPIRTKPASTSISALAARRRECWRPLRYAASAGRCRRASCSIPRRSASAPPMGIKDPRRKYQIEDMVKGECLFAATGVTDGRMLRGVQFGREVLETETVVMRSTSGTIRWIRAEHRQSDKFR